MRTIFVALGVSVAVGCVLVGVVSLAQTPAPAFGIQEGTALPSTCQRGQLYILDSPLTLHVCTATNVWSMLGWAGGAVPRGSILFVSTGSCPTGYTELAALDGRMVRGTIASHANVGTPGGSDTATPTFTGTPQSFTTGSAPGRGGTAMLTPNPYTPVGVISPVDTRAAYLNLIGCSRN